MCISAIGASERTMIEYDPKSVIALLRSASVKNAA
jgi:hypothetical protein